MFPRIQRAVSRASLAERGGRVKSGVLSTRIGFGTIRPLSAAPSLMPAPLPPRPASSSRSLALRLALAAALTLCLGACGHEDEPSASPGPAQRTPGQAPSDTAGEKPLSIILVSIDTLRRDHVGFYGYERNTTPFLDQLAEKSLVFDNAYTAFSWTLVAHMSLVTGLYPSQHGVWREDAALPESVPTIAERLQSRGYYTMGFHDSRWLEKRYGFARGYDVYERHHGAAIAGRQMEQAMLERPKAKPFFLFLHLMDVHNAPLEPGRTMYEPPEPFDELFQPGAKEVLAELDPGTAWNESEGITPEQHEALVALYDGGIRYADTKLGEWIELWWKAGLLDNAVLIITSDHGEGLDQRGTGYGGHGFAFNEGLRVPLMIHFPGDARGGERVEQPVSHVDILPTILDGLGMDADARLPGFSLVSGRPEDSVIYAEQPNRMEAFIRWPWKLIRPTGANAHKLRLFHLENDPDELEPLTVEDAATSQYTRISTEFGKRIAAERARWFRPKEPNPDAGPLSEEATEALKALGYLGGNDDN